MRVRAAAGARVGRWRAWGAAAHPRVRDALAAALSPRAAPLGADPLAALDPLDRAVYRAAERLSLADAADAGDAAAPAPLVPPASGLAVVDHQDTYVALVTSVYRFVRFTVFSHRVTHSITLYKISNYRNLQWTVAGWRGRVIGRRLALRRAAPAARPGARHLC